MKINYKFLFLLFLLMGVLVLYNNNGLAQTEYSYYPYPSSISQYILLANNDQLNDLETEGEEITPVNNSIEIDKILENYDPPEDMDFFQLKDYDLLAEDEFNYQLLPGIFLETRYDEEDDKYDLKLNSDINFKYAMGDNTFITADYFVLNKQLLEDDEALFMDNGDFIDFNDFLQQQENQGRLGVVYQNKDNIIFSADYIDNNLRSQTSGYTTSVALEYYDDLAQLKAKYQYDHSEEIQERFTGVELGLMDLARISASYELFDPELVNSKWDFGLDLNLSDISRFSIGYELIDHNSENNNPDMEKNKQSNIEASLEIQF